MRPERPGVSSCRMCCAAPSRACRSCRPACRRRGILRERANDERGEEEQSRLDRPGIVGTDDDWSPSPALTVEDGHLSLAVDKRVALAPAAGRAERERMPSPAQGPASAYSLGRELAHCRTRPIRCSDTRPPKSVAAELPALATGRGRRRTGPDAREAQRADTLQCIEPADARHASEFEIGQRPVSMPDRRVAMGPGTPW
jgi:hypothetical protein